MPLKTALRNTFFLPKASSRTGGQVAKNSHSVAATAIKMISAHNGWRSMNLVMDATCVSSGAQGDRAVGLRQPVRDDGRRLEHSTPCRLLSSPGAMVVCGPRPSYWSARSGLDRQYSFARRLGRSGPQDLGGAPVIRRRHADIAGEKVRKCALRSEAKIEANVGDGSLGGHQRVQSSLHQQRVEVEVRGNTGLGAEEFVE